MKRKKNCACKDCLPLWLKELEKRIKSLEAIRQSDLDEISDMADYNKAEAKGLNR